MIQRPKKESYLRSDRMVLGAQSQHQVPCTLPQPFQTHQEYSMSSIGKHATQYAKLSPTDWRQLLSPMSPPGHPVPFWSLRPLNSHVQFPKWKHPDLCTISPQLYKESVCIWHPFL
ncbi:hypothetical protein ACRRTK_011223 [Alexandromys fortis]